MLEQITAHIWQPGGREGREAREEMGLEERGEGKEGARKNEYL